jgi:hypothetical protein
MRRTFVLVAVVLLHVRASSLVPSLRQQPATWPRKRAAVALKQRT